jgi:hypothetical protein
MLAGRDVVSTGVPGDEVHCLFDRDVFGVLADNNTLGTRYMAFVLSSACNTYYFAFIVGLVVLTQLRDNNLTFWIVDGSVWFEEDRGKGRCRTTGDLPDWWSSVFLFCQKSFL